MKNLDLEILEHMASRFNPLPTGDTFLNDRYDCQTKNGTEWPYYRFFYHLSKMLKPKVVVELGGWQGTAAAHFAAGYPDSKVITIDHHTDPGDAENKMEMLEVCDRYSNVEYIQAWTTAKIAAREYGKHALGSVGNAYNNIIDETLYYGRKIDILFIDSWHTYENAMLDWETYQPLMSSPGLVICDDILESEIKDGSIVGMELFWEELPEPKFLNSNLHPASKIGFVKI